MNKKILIRFFLAVLSFDLSAVKMNDLGEVEQESSSRENVQSTGAPTEAVPIKDDDRWWCLLRPLTPEDFPKPSPESLADLDEMKNDELCQNFFKSMYTSSDTINNDIIAFVSPLLLDVDYHFPCCFLNVFSGFSTLFDVLVDNDLLPVNSSIFDFFCAQDESLFHFQEKLSNVNKIAQDANTILSLGDHAIFLTKFNSFFQYCEKYHIYKNIPQDLNKEILLKAILQINAMYTSFIDCCYKSFFDGSSVDFNYHWFRAVSAFGDELTKSKKKNDINLDDMLPPQTFPAPDEDESYDDDNCSVLRDTGNNEYAYKKNHAAGTEDTIAEVGEDNVVSRPIDAAGTEDTIAEAGEDNVVSRPIDEAGTEYGFSQAAEDAKDNVVSRPIDAAGTEYGFSQATEDAKDNVVSRPIDEAGTEYGFSQAAEDAKDNVVSRPIDEASTDDDLHESAGLLSGKRNNGLFPDGNIFSKLRRVLLF